MKKIPIFILFFSLAVTAVGQNSYEKNMVDQINKLRSDPKSFIPYVEIYIYEQTQLLKSSANIKRTVVSGKKTKVITGKELIFSNITDARSLINTLNKTKPMGKVAFSEDMYVISIDQGIFLDSLGALDHNHLSKRFESIALHVSENLYKCDNTCDALSCLIDLLIDAGHREEKYGHRKNLLNPKIKFVSVYKGKTVWVQNFAY